MPYSFKNNGSIRSAKRAKTAKRPFREKRDGRADWADKSGGVGGFRRRTCNDMMIHFFRWQPSKQERKAPPTCRLTLCPRVAIEEER